MAWHHCIKHCSFFFVMDEANVQMKADDAQININNDVKYFLS